MLITGELVLLPYLPVIEKETNSWSSQQRYHGRSAKMDPVTAITSVLMAIAAQGSVTITIPNDAEITRELGPIEFTHQLGPIKLKIQTAPAKNSSQVAPAKTTNKAAPAEATSQAAPAKNTNEAAPVDATSQGAPAKVASQTPPAEVSSQDAPAQATGYAGLWYDHTGRSAIKITNCGDGLCGRIAWLKNSTHNSVCGTSIIGGGKRVGNSYDTGWIYSPERGRKFDVELKLLNENELRVMGYAGTKLLSKTMIWNRAPSNLQLCS